MKQNYFQIVSYTNVYFLEPTQEYYREFGREFLHTIAPYTYGATGKVCMVEITHSEKTRTLHIERFTSYPTQWHRATGKPLPSLYKGLGKYLLGRVLEQFDPSYMITVCPSKDSLDVLIPYYESIGFTRLIHNTLLMKGVVENVKQQLSK